VPGFVNYKKGCTPLASASDKVYQLLAHGRWFSPGTPASSTTKIGRHDIAEILLKVALNIKSNHNQIVNFATTFSITTFCLCLGIYDVRVRVMAFNTPSTIFQYRGSQFYWWRKPEYSQVTDKLLSHNVSSTPRHERDLNSQH
jgi:hypothetical protein